LVKENDMLNGIWRLVFRMVGGLPRDFTEEQLRQFAVTFVEVGEFIAPRTKITWDDWLVAELKAVVESQELFHAFYLVVKYFVDQIGSAPDHHLVHERMAAATGDVATAKSLLGDKLIQAALLLAELLVRFFFGEDK